jgi:hypothetical protein
MVGLRRTEKPLSISFPATDGCRGGLGSADSRTLAPLRLPRSAHIRAVLPAPRPRWAAVAVLACAAARSSDDAPKITVQALPRFEALRCLDDPGQLTVRGRLLDDVGVPLADAAVELARPGAAAVLMAPCGARDPHWRSGTIRTDVAGEICVGLPKASATGSLTLRFRGDSLHLPAQAELSLEPRAGELELSFDSPSLELSLDEPEQRLGLQLSGDGAAAGGLPAIALQLEDRGRAHPLTARGWSRSGNSLSFSVDSAQLGTPGPARLLAQVVGSAGPSARAEAVALRSAHVRLESAGLTRGTDAVELRITAQSRAGVPSSGWVDVSEGEQSLASSPLVSGVATLQVPLTDAAPARWLARYHSDDPWWQPGEPLPIDSLTLAAREPARWPWLVLLAPVGYVCVRALQRPGFRKPRRAARRAPAPAPSPALRSEEGAAPAGWSGTLTDAHDGRPIPGARVTASLPSLREETSGVSDISDAHGHYALPPLREPIPEGAQLSVTSRLHSDFQRPLPPQGRVDVTLTSRRRALLGRLVRWARAAGPPWHRTTEPTPAEIANVAVRRGELDTARWAEGVQAAAFDHSEVDREREAALQAVEPAWQKEPPRGQPQRSS